MQKLKEQLPLIVIVILATAFLGSIIFAGFERVAPRQTAGVGGGGSGFEGGEAIRDIIGTKDVPTQGATSTSANNSGCDGCQVTTSTRVIFLQNADTATVQFDMIASTTASEANWYYEVSNSPTCEVDGRWFVRTTSTEMLGADFQQSPGNATPTDQLIPGVKGQMSWEQTISNLNTNCLKLTYSFASSTDDSSIHVSVALQ
jgi:hypothetical protein